MPTIKIPFPLHEGLEVKELFKYQDMENLDLYNKVREVPKEAQKSCQAIQCNWTRSFQRERQGL